MFLINMIRNAAGLFCHLLECQMYYNISDDDDDDKDDDDEMMTMINVDKVHGPEQL